MSGASRVVVYCQPFGFGKQPFMRDHNPMKSTSFLLIVLCAAGCSQEARTKPSSTEVSAPASETSASTADSVSAMKKVANPFSITVTDIAAEKFRAALLDNPTMTHVSFSVEFNKGCKGFLYNLGLVSQPSESNSVLLESNGVKLAVNKESMEFLSGTTLDFATLKSGVAGFVFRNPNEDKSLPDELK